LKFACYIFLSFYPFTILFYFILQNTFLLAHVIPFFNLV
jgi:hypothetical protein